MSGLRDIERKASRYTSSDDYYPSSFDAGSLITGYLLGNMSASSVSSTIESDHHVREPEPVYTPSYSSPSSSDWSSNSSSNSSSDFSSGGGCGGGGFSSGSGF